MGGRYHEVIGNYDRAWHCAQEGGVVVQFDGPIAALFRAGMIVTATFQQLSNGSSSRWELSSPGYVWPSWYCEKGCMSTPS